jgi:hypothetical protein
MSTIDGAKENVGSRRGADYTGSDKRAEHRNVNVVRVAGIFARLARNRRAPRPEFSRASPGIFARFARIM